VLAWQDTNAAAPPSFRGNVALICVRQRFISRRPAGVIQGDIAR
jgi:hypothetical protein